MQHDAVTNLRKAKSLYISRQQEYDKLKEQVAKAETESDRKKKQEDDALQKVCLVMNS